MRNLRIDEQRLWDSLMEMARIGATEKGGSRRLALSDEDREGRDLFVSWCRDAGCEITIDSMGNIFARRPGRDPARAPVATGSHLDTQPHGGRFDGVYGVLAGLEVVRALNEADTHTEAPLEIVCWSNEEGARFAPSMVASGVFVGSYEQVWAHERRDADGNSFGKELGRIGYAGDQRCGDHPLGAFLEAHIEQGPVLEAEGRTIGVVTAVQGLRWYDVEIEGQDSHAGSTPMERRRDALLGAADIVRAVRELTQRHAPDARATVGEMRVSPNSRNTIPGHVFLTVDLRHPSAETLELLDGELREWIEGIAGTHGLHIGVEQVQHTPPVLFHEDCVDAVREAAKDLGYPHRDMLSGAGHDACHIAKVAPTAMIFVPCADGLSHNELESATPSDLAAGANVLMHAMLRLAG
jgi:beta-ureidopropionase / N-carbamoyl-L-amino-acid hydrolase